MKLKRISALLLCAALMLSALAGCGTTVVVGPEGGKPAAGTPAPAESQTPAESQGVSGGDAAPVKTGLAVLPSVSSSKDASAEGDGTAQSEILLVAVTVGDDGVIESCVIDNIQAKIGFSASGALTTDPSTTFPSKNELGGGYGMGKASSIGKEWNEQAAGFCAYVTGKTAAQVAGLAVDESGKAADADLAATVTVGIGEFQALIEKAAQ